MRRFSRTEFLAFGLLPALNAVGLVIRGLEISTTGDYAEGKTMPFLIALIPLSFLITVVAAVFRACDRGADPRNMFAMALLAAALGPALLLLLLFLLAFLPGRDENNPYGSGPRSMSASRWLTAGVILATPWCLLAVLARVL